MNDFECLDSEQVAHLLGCSKRTVFRMVKAGTLPQPIRFNKKLVRWDAGTLTRWMLDRGMQRLPGGRVPSPAPPPSAPPAAPASPRRVYSVKQIARALLVSDSTVYRYAERLGLKKRPIGRGFVASDEEIKKLMEECVRQGELTAA